MGTRAFIKVEGTPVALYKHFDGYPEGTLPWLVEFHSSFIENRGVDPDYEIAQLVRSSVLLADKYGLDDSKLTGWGLYVIDNDEEIGGMISYVYTLKNDGTIVVTE